MKILNIAIALAALIFACIIGSASTGGMGSLWDAISLIIVVIPAYFLTAAAANSYTFFNDKKSVLLFGELAWGFGLIGTFIGFIFVCGGMALPPPPGVDPTAILISNIAIAIITILYGLLVKYGFAIPFAHSIKES